ncbi:hypothetical protein ILUMI_19639 [Ignelater luminosus]|uniref:Reverse transcriptase/retrotransposon-derived protein RNase H-like domain-containing protein n=1 Tax=Ignelater luminosus TaxID=2038154 RepID=A0A8K0CHT4_IGNLU|nr:hypothetical protein ILUMI_19639 [Ignelater luminosus]
MSQENNNSCANKQQAAGNDLLPPNHNFIDRPIYVEDIWDIIESAQEDKYYAAKEKLLNIFKESEDKRIKRLATGLNLGNEKPSQFLRRMKALAGEDITEKVLRTLWINKIPGNITNIFPISDENLDKLSKLADKIAEINPHSEIYSRVSLALCTDASELAIEAVLQQYEGDGWKPIAAFSRKLTTAQKAYCTMTENYWYNKGFFNIYPNFLPRLFTSTDTTIS